MITARKSIRLFGAALLFVLVTAAMLPSCCHAQTSPVLTTGFALDTNGVVVSPTNFWPANSVLNTTSNDGRFVNVAGDVMTGELGTPGLVTSYTNFVTVRPGLNVFQFWTATNSIVGTAVPTLGVASYDTTQCDTLYVTESAGQFRIYYLLPGPTWYRSSTFQPATNESDTISADVMCYYYSRASTNVQFQIPTMAELVTGEENVFALSGQQYPNFFALDFQSVYRLQMLWYWWATKAIVTNVTGSGGITATRTGGTIEISLGSTNSALQGPVLIDATNLTIRVGSHRQIGTNVVMSGFAWNETNSGTLAWVTVTNGSTNAVTVYHSGNFSPGSYLSQSAWAGAQTGLLAFVGAPTSYNAAGSARQVATGAMNGTNYWFFYGVTNWERIAVGARPW